MERVNMWVCSACGGVYFPEVAQARGKCPGCGGEGKVTSCTRDPAGVVTPARKE